MRNFKTNKACARCLLYIRNCPIVFTVLALWFLHEGFIFMQEVWRPTFISEYYEVSNLGRVRSVERYVKGKHNNLALRKGKLLKPGVSRVGYLRVCIPSFGVRRMISVHRLVCMAFVINNHPETNNQINHKDGVKRNNNAENLEWCTVTENNRHARDMGLNVTKTGKNNHSYGFNNKQSFKVKNRLSGEVKPICEACLEYPFTRRHFTMMVKGERTNKTEYDLIT